MRAPPGGPNSFIFMQFQQKVEKIIPFWELAPPIRKILDLPLDFMNVWGYDVRNVSPQP